MDATGRILSVPGGDEFSSSSGIVTVVTSPNVPSMFLPQQHNNDDETASAVVSTRLPERPNDCTLLICQGSTLGPSPATSTAGISTTSSIGVLSPEELRCSGLAVCSAVANAIVVEGVTVGDVEAGLRHTRHARTLTALFRARVAVTTTTTIEALNEKESITSVDGDDATNIQKQTLIVAISDAPDDDLDESAVLLEVNEIFQAATVCSNNGKDMTDLYEIRVVSLSALSSSNVRILS